MVFSSWDLLYPPNLEIVQVMQIGMQAICHIVSILFATQIGMKATQIGMKAKICIISMYVYIVSILFATQIGMKAKISLNMHNYYWTYSLFTFIQLVLTLRDKFLIKAYAFYYLQKFQIMSMPNILPQITL